MGNEQSRQPLGEYAGGRGGGVSWINEKLYQQQRQHFSILSKLLHIQGWAALFFDYGLWHKDDGNMYVDEKGRDEEHARKLM